MIWVRHLFVSLLAAIMGLAVLGIMAIGVLQFMMTRGPLELPRVQALVETRINDQLSEETLSIGSISLASGAQGSANRVILNDVTLRGSDGKSLITVPEIRTDFSLMNLFRGTITPSEIEIVGTDLKLLRQMDGSIRLLRLSGADDTAFDGDVFAQIDALFSRSELKKLKSIALRNTDVLVRDERSGHSWEITDSLLKLTREDGVLALRTEVSVGVEAGGKTDIIASAKHKLGSDDAEFTLQFFNSAPQDLADMVGALDWMRILETRVSGSLTATIARDGAVGALNGVLDLGQGRLRETPSSVPIEFDSAKVYFSYDKAKDRLEFAQLKVNTTAGAVTSEGYANLSRTAAGGVASMAGQFRFDNLLLNRPKEFADPLALDAAALDFRVSFNPLTVEVGSLTVFDGDATYRIKGSSVAGLAFWENSYDIEVSNAQHDRVMAFWPLRAIPKTREWLAENVRAGEINNFRGGLRSVAGKFKYAFNFEVSGARVRFMKTMPELRDGQGYGYLTSNDVRVDLQQGHLIAPDNTVVDLAGSSFYIPDINRRPAIGDITVDARGGVQAALHLLDVEKFEFLKKVGLTPQVASGMVEAKGSLQVPLTKDAKPKDVTFEAVAQIRNLASDTLIKGRKLRGLNMQLKTTHKGLELVGPVTLDGVPMQARWRLGFGPAAAKGSEVVADIGLSEENLDGLGIKLPKGSISGETPARVVVNIKKGHVPTYTVSSKLVGARLRVPALQWVKSTKAAGSLTLRGSFGETPTVDNISLTAPGMKANGKIDLRNDGTMQALRLEKLRVGRWLDSSATIVLGKRGNADISLNGGAADMRNFNISNGAGGDSSSAGSPIDVRLDKLTIVTGIALTNFVAKLVPGRGMSGTFTGRVNGGTPISGTLFPHKFGTAFEIIGKDAGRILASANLMNNVYEGDLKVVIVPRAKAGEYDGTLLVNRTRMTSTSAMAGLMNGISVVGALQQLEGQGIHFSKVEGKFLMRPNGVQIKDISAVGPSIGITLDGWYNSADRTVDFEGVTTPLYAINGLFQRALGKLGGRKKGEGLFSFTYKMKGPADSPKVSVNPLSILTPGAFREIFRSKPPTALTVETSQKASDTDVEPTSPKKKPGKKVQRVKKPKIPLTRSDAEDFR